MGDLETTKAMMIELAMRFAADAVKKISLKSERNDLIKARAAKSSPSSTAAVSSVKKRPAAAAVEPKEPKKPKEPTEQNPASKRFLKELYQEFTSGPGCEGLC